MIFLLFTRLYLVILLKINLLILWKETSIEKALLTLHVTTVLDKIKARDFNTTSLSTYYFSTPHNLIKDKIIDLIERTFNREGSPYLACNDKNMFFTSKKS